MMDDPAACLNLTRCLPSVWHQQRQRVQLPALGLLEAYLKRPLPEQEKVPISKEYLTIMLAAGLDQGVLLSVFRLVDIEVLGTDHKRPFTVVNAVMKDPPTSGTEDAFHGDWDVNIRTIIEVCVPGGISQRNSHIATRKVRPDYTYCIGEACPFRGEEETPENTTEDLRQELAANLVWMFGSVTPYTLGYDAKGTCVTLVALTAPQSGGNVGIHDLVRVDLSSWRGRIQNIVHLLNLSTLLDPLSQLMDRSGPEFLRLERDTCTIEFTSFVIVKTFRDSAKAEHLCSLYDLIVANNVPNTDRVSYSSGNIVHLKPRGSAFRPRTVQELYECVRCVLEALVVAHRIPLYHRDIRPENVMRKIEDPSKWFLVDWEDAASGPRTLAQPHFASETHCPEVFHDDHGVEVDIWGVGLLIEERCRFAGRLLSKFGQSLQKQARELTATDALRQLDDIYNNLPAL